MKAVLVFCEGRHDVVFAQRSSRRSRSVASGSTGPIGELPSPFGPGRAVANRGIIATRFERRALEDLGIQAAANPPLPCFESVVEDSATGTMFFMVRAAGKHQSAPVLELLQALDVTITDEPAGRFDVSEYAAAFLFDANGEGVGATVARWLGFETVTALTSVISRASSTAGG